MIKQVVKHAPGSIPKLFGEVKLLTVTVFSFLGVSPYCTSSHELRGFTLIFPFAIRFLPWILVTTDGNL